MDDITLSKKYLHDLKKLNIDHEEGQITDEEFSQRIDELREREARSKEALGHMLLLRKLEEAERDIEDEVKRESRRKLQELKAENMIKQKEEYLQRRKKEQDQKEREEKRHEYRRRANWYIGHLEDNAQKWQLWYTWLQIILLVFSAGTATMASIDGVPRPIVSVTGLIATVAGGLLTTFKIQDRIYASRKAVAEVTLECQKYDYRIEDYQDMNDDDAFIKFSRTINGIQGQEMLQEVELWNPKKDDSSARDNEAQRSLTAKAESKEKLDEQQSVENPQSEEPEQAKIDPHKE
jgi:ABC-type multidrug transport system fused ATPase/permease subunit